MKSHGTSILNSLAEVGVERAVRATDPAFGYKVMSVKHYQHARFAQTYRDLLADPQCSEACRFFLDELYGLGDFSLRDAQFAKIVPALCRLFPDDVVAMVQALAQLHALSEQLDSEMARHVTGRELGTNDYANAWHLTGRPDLRVSQRKLLQTIGAALQLYTRKPLLKHALRAMREPAKAAGLFDLQRFLEKGFTVFGKIKDAKKFMATVNQRETEIAEKLFADT